MPDKTTPHIQRAARAIWLAPEYTGGPPPGEDLGEPDEQDARICAALATAALSTTLEPSEAEIDEGGIAYLISEEDSSEEWTRTYWRHAKGSSHQHGVPITCDRCIYEEAVAKVKPILIAAARVRVRE